MAVVGLAVAGLSVAGRAVVGRAGTTALRVVVAAFSSLVTGCDYFVAAAVEGRAVPGLAVAAGLAVVEGLAFAEAAVSLFAAPLQKSTTSGPFASINLNVLTSYTPDF